MRDIKTLLEVLLDQYQKHKDNDVRGEGLCYVIEVLHEPYGVFTKDEKDSLMSFIYEHRPDPDTRKDDFWWRKGSIYPRIKFLMRLMNRL